MLSNRRTFLGGLSAAFALRNGTAQGAETGFHSDVASSAAGHASESSKLVVLLPHGSLGNVGPVSAEFTRLTGIDIEHREVSVDEINTQLILDSLSGQAEYDIALPATFGIPDLVDAGAIRNLSDYARAHEPTGYRDDMLYTVGDTFDGEVYGFQTDGDVYTMFYNVDCLADPEQQARYEDRFGETLEMPVTWDELDRQMAFFHAPESDRFGGALFRVPDYLAWEWWVRFHAKGKWPFSREMEPQIQFDEGVSALEEMIAATEFLHPGTRAAGLFENWEIYSKGNVYCNIGWGGTQKFLNGPTSSMRGKMLFGPTPGGMIDGALLHTPYFNWGWSYVVTSTCKVPELAYLYGLFATSPEISAVSVREASGYFDPFRDEHYRDAHVIEAYSEEFLAVHQDSMLNAIPDLYLARQGEYFRALNQWLGRAIAGEIDPKTALTRVSQAWELTTDSSGRDAQIRRWLELRGKYPERARKTLTDFS